MKKQFLAVAFSVMVTLGVKAQQVEKISIGVLPTQVVGKNSENQLMTESLTNAFLKTKRFDVVDRSKLSALKRERELQKTEDFMDGAVIEQSRSMGAKYLLSSTLADYVNQGDVCRFTLNLTLIDVETGKVVAAESITPKSGGFGKQLLALGTSVALGTDVTLTSEDKALRKAIENIVPKVDEFVIKNFPISFSIIEVQEKSGNVAKTLLVSGGSDAGVKKGGILKVVEIVPVNVNGKIIERKKEIGELKVEKVEDENFSICSVKSGGAEILTKVNNNIRIQVTFK